MVLIISLIAIAKESLLYHLNLGIGPWKSQKQPNGTQTKNKLDTLGSHSKQNKIIRQNRRQKKA